MNVTSRPAAETDREFLWGLHCQTMRPVIEATWGWDEQWQRQDFDLRLRSCEVMIVECDGQICGGLFLEWLPDSLYIRELQILPVYQSRGIGSVVVRSVIDMAAARGLPVALSVVPANPGAQRLYERLGFEVSSIEPPFLRMEHRQQIR